MPTPWGLVVKKGSKILPRIESGMPGPSSATTSIWNSPEPGRERVRTSTFVDPEPTAWIAFIRRLRRT